MCVCEVRTAHVAVLTIFFKCNNNSSVNRNRNKTRITCSLWLSCLVLSQIVSESYGKVKSAQRNEEQQQEEKSNWCTKSVSKAKRRRERKSDRVHNSAHRAEESRWQEWVGNRVSNATWLLVCCVAVIFCRCVSFNWLNEWIAIPSEISRTKRNGQNAHASTHDFQSNRAQKKQMQNKNGHETDCRQFTLASFLRKCTLQTSVKQPDFVYRCHVWIWQFDNKEWKCTANQLAPKKGTWKRNIEALNSMESEKKKRT